LEPARNWQIDFRHILAQVILKVAVVQTDIFEKMLFRIDFSAYVT
jgi:hypothetical protein